MPKTESSPSLRLSLQVRHSLQTMGRQQAIKRVEINLGEPAASGQEAAHSQMNLPEVTFSDNLFSILYGNVGCDGV